MKIISLPDLYSMVKSYFDIKSSMHCRQGVQHELVCVESSPGVCGHFVP